MLQSNSVERGIYLRFPWDKNYFKVSFYLCLGLSCFYLIKVSIDAVVIAIADIGKITGGIGLLFKDMANMFLPLIIALIAAYLLDPAVSFFQKKWNIFFEKNKYGKKIISLKKPNGKKYRTAGTISTYITLIGALFILGARVFGTGVKASAGDSLAHKITSITNQLNDMVILIKLKLIEWNLGEGAVEFVDRVIDTLKRIMAKGSGEVLSGITSAGKFLGNFFIGLVVAFYLLQRKEEILPKLDDIMKTLLKGKIYKKIIDILRDLNEVFSSYIRGQMTDALIMSILVGSGLKIIGVDFAVVIGILTGFTNLVPFLGAITGFVLSVIMALITGPPVKALYAAVFVIIVQQVDGMFIVPKVVGRKVSLSPAAVILAVAIGGRIAGFLGMVIVVPICSLIKIWFARFMQKKKEARESAHKV